MNILDPLEALLEVLLHGLGVLGLPQNLEQIVIRHEVEPGEHHPIIPRAPVELKISWGPCLGHGRHTNRAISEEFERRI